jgi:hypothetical protein
MNQQRSNGAFLDGARLNGVSHDSNPAQEFQVTGDEKVAYDHQRFPDGFYTGIIVFLDRARGRGIIRSPGGREIRFQFPFVTVAGASLGGRAPGIDSLHQGDRVGFDVGWTSKGLRVTAIKPPRNEARE